MTRSRELATLAMMQRLKTERCEGKLAAAQSDRESKTRKQAQLADAKQAAESSLDEMLSADTFCPDRMLMTVGHLVEAERVLAAGQDDLADAEKHEAAARREWRETDIRTEILSNEAKSARRKEERRSEDALAAEQNSLRAALQKGHTQ